MIPIRSHRAHLAETGLPTHVRHIPGDRLDADMLMKHIGQDKKVEAGALTFILLDCIGAATVVKNVDPAPIRDFLIEELNQQ